MGKEKDDKNKIEIVSAGAYRRFGSYDRCGKRV